MAENIEKIEDFDFKPGQVASRELTRKFGNINDYAELHVLSLSDQLLQSNLNFTSFNSPPEGIDSEGLISEISMDPTVELNKLGYISGKYKIKLNLLRRKILNSPNLLFSIKEISSSRNELKLRLNSSVNNTQTISSIRNFINEVESNVFFKDFGLNFNKGTILTAINIALDERGTNPEILIKLLKPLPPTYSINDDLNIVEEIIDPIVLTINLGIQQEEDNSISLRGPNFKIDVKLNNSIPSTLKTYDSILNNSSVLSSSYNQLLNYLEKGEVPEIPYDYIRPISESFLGESDDVPYHFENFINFSSATERLKNFEYKVKLIESYDKKLEKLNLIPTPQAASISNQSLINNQKNDLLKGLDGYERFLYYTSGSFAYPKSNTTPPFNLHPISSAEVKTWLGSEISSNPNYGGQLLSASLYDRQNQNNLERLVPNHILDNENNDQYRLFINMIGQHFDQVWVHIKHLTEINDTHHKRGISKDLVYFTLKGLGVEAFDQFENDNLIEYILGEGTSGSAFYGAPVSQSLITASNEGSVAKQNISKEIWKRLYHNAPYLLKTKGTEKGLHALMNCYGIPPSVLNVKEYGGSTTDKTTFKTFTYEKSSLAIEGGSLTTSDHVLRTNWSTLNQGPANSKTIEVRAKPRRPSNTSNEVNIFEMGNIANLSANVKLCIQVSSSGIDVYETGDNIKFGRLAYKRLGATHAVTEYFPIYNGDFWNIHLACDVNDLVTFGAYQANFNKNIFHYTASDSTVPNTYNNAFGVNALQGYLGLFVGTNFYSGSFQELRSYWGETLSHETHRKHALEPFMYAGNTISSSYDTLVLRHPLGSTDIETLENHIPNYNLSTLNSNTLTHSNPIVFKEIIETHFLPTPDTVGISMTSEKVRIDEGTIDDDMLSSTIKTETSTLDRQPQDFEDLGVFFSPTTEINEDIIYTLGAFRLDDYIGSPLPSAQSSSKYVDLKELRDTYFQKVEDRYNYWDYIKLIQYVDHTLFKLIEQWVPFKSNLKTGLLIEPHYLERNKFARELPVVDYGTTMTEGSYQTFDFQIDPERAFSLQGSSVVTTNVLTFATGSDGKRREQGTNGTINVSGHILDESQQAAQAPIKPVFKGSDPSGSFDHKIKRISNTLLGNATKGKKSSRYYSSLQLGSEYNTEI